MKRKTALVSVFSMLIAVAAYITNLGLLRVVLFLMLIPFAHIVIIITVNVLAIVYADKSSKIRMNNLYFCLSYVIFNVFYPDYTETNSIVFFGLIRNDVMCEIGRVIALIALIAHIGLLINQIILATRTKLN